VLIVLCQGVLSFPKSQDKLQINIVVFKYNWHMRFSTINAQCPLLFCFLCVTVCYLLPDVDFIDKTLRIWLGESIMIAYTLQK
jgi:hypothetical protein